MNTFNFYIGYPNPASPTLVTQPDNWMDLQLELSFEDQAPEAVFNAKKLIWKGANAYIMNEWLQAGLTGGVGIFEGIPLRITVCNSNDLVFDGVIDLTDSETTFSCDIVQVALRDKRLDAITMLLDSISFAYLESLGPGQPGKITAGCEAALGNGGFVGDYIPVAYQRNDIPSTESIMTLILTIWNIYQIIEEIVEGVQAAVAAAIQVAGGFPSTGAIAAGTLEAVLWTAYVVALTLMLISLTQAAIDCLVSPVLTKFGMFARTLMQRACDYFGYTFVSTILNNPGSPYNNVIILPEKNAWEKNENFVIQILTLGSINNLMEYDDLYNINNAGNAYGYYDSGSIGDFFRSMEDVFNAKMKIIVNSLGQAELHFERWDFQYDLATYTLPNISDQAPFNSAISPFNITGGSKSAFGTNASEIMANYNLKYALDSSDVNTYNYYNGTSCFSVTSPNIYSAVANPSTVKTHVLLQGLKEYNFEFSQAKRKDKETSIEKFFEDIWGFIHATILVADITTLGIGTAIFGTLPSTLSFASAGQMLLSADITGTPKILMAGLPQTYTGGISISSWGGRTFRAYTVDPNNKGEVSMGFPNLSTRSLFKNFHYSSLPVSVAPTDPAYATPYTPGLTHFNQWLLYKDQQIPLCCADYELIKNNNTIKTYDGKFAKVDSLKWNPYKGIATIDYRINTPYTKNVQETFIVDGIDNFDVNTL